MEIEEEKEIIPVNYEYSEIPDELKLVRDQVKKYDLGKYLDNKIELPIIDINNKFINLNFEINKI